MKLSFKSLQDTQAWKGYHLPQYDVAAVAARTQKNPRWLHFGAGNIFRAFPCVVAQRLIENGDMDTGIVCCEGYDDEIVTACFRPVDNLSIAVTLNPDGNIDKEVVGSLCESLTMKDDAARVAEIFRSDSLQMVSFTITEKGYSLRNANHELMPAVAEDMENGPAACKTFMAQLAALCLERYHAGAKPLALVSMDNCSHNGEKLQNAVIEIVEAWQKNGRISAEEAAYFTTGITFPWSMIDKITPRPNESVEAQLTADGVEDVKPFVTTKHTYIAPFVNAEKPQYLVIEDLFPGGRPPLEKAGIIYFFVHQDVAHDRPVDLQPHQRAQIVPVGQLVLLVFVRAQERQRRSLPCALLIQIIRVEQIDAALRVLVAAPEQRVPGRAREPHRIRALCALVQIQELGMRQIAARHAGLLLVQQPRKQQAVVVRPGQRGQNLVFAFHQRMVLSLSVVLSETIVLFPVIVYNMFIV